MPGIYKAQLIVHLTVNDGLEGRTTSGKRSRSDLYYRGTISSHVTFQIRKKLNITHQFQGTIITAQYGRN